MKLLSGLVLLMSAIAIAVTPSADARASGRALLHVNHFDSNVRPNRETRRAMSPRLRSFFMLTDGSNAVTRGEFKRAIGSLAKLSRKAISEAIASGKAVVVDGTAMFAVAGGDGTEDLYDEATVALIARLESTEEPLSDEELETLRASLVAKIQELNAEDNDDALEEMTKVKADIVRIDTEATARTEAAEERAKKREEIMADVEIPVAETPAEEVEEETTTEETTETVEPATDTPAEPSGEAEVAELPVAAAAPSPGAVKRVSRRAQDTRVDDNGSALSIVASGDVDGFSAGARMNLDQLSEAFASKGRAVAELRSGGRFPVAKMKLAYPEERHLRSGDRIGNDRKLEKIESGIVASVGSPEALVAAICGPYAVDYSIDTVGVSDRPVRDALVRVGADRGGVQYTPPFTIDDFDIAGEDAVIKSWSSTDQDGVDPTDASTWKPVITMSCPQTDTAEVYAIPLIVEIDNFTARFRQELFPAFWEQARVAHARVGDTGLLTALANNSTSVTAGKLLGAARDALTTVLQAKAAIAYRHRTGDLPFRAILPQWLRSLMVSDMLRQIPGDNAFERAGQLVDQAFRDANINVTWAFDDPTNPFAAQTPGALNNYPADATFLLYPEGTHVFLDGGELNLGLENRSPEANRRNVVSAFLETFEGTFRRGAVSYEVTIEGICATGEVAGTSDTSALCADAS